MNFLKLFVLSFLPLLFSCDLKVQEQQLQKRSDSLTQKEQQLLILESQITARQADLAKKERVLDSVLKQYIVPDSLSPKNTFVVGRWNVKMVCTETTCAGSAVGDNKTEIWEVEYQDNAIVAKAMVNNQLVRVYTGTANNTGLVLAAQQDSASMGTSMQVNLSLQNKNEMEGERRIIRADGCRIVYSMQMQKIVTP